MLESTCCPSKYRATLRSSAAVPSVLSMRRAEAPSSGPARRLPAGAPRGGGPPGPGEGLWQTELSATWLRCRSVRTWLHAGTACVRWAEEWCWSHTSPPETRHTWQREPWCPWSAQKARAPPMAVAQVLPSRASCCAQGRLGQPGLRAGLAVRLKCRCSLRTPDPQARPCLACGAVPGSLEGPRSRSLPHPQTPPRSWLPEETVRPPPSSPRSPTCPLTSPPRLRWRRKRRRRRKPMAPQAPPSSLPRPSRRPPQPPQPPWRRTRLPGSRAVTGPRASRPPRRRRSSARPPS